MATQDPAFGDTLADGSVQVKLAGRWSRLTPVQAEYLATELAKRLDQPRQVNVLEAVTLLALVCDECGAPLDQLQALECRACHDY